MEKRSSIALITSILVISGIFLAILFNFKIKNTESPAASSSEISKTETKAETNNTDSKKRNYYVNIPNAWDNEGYLVLSDNITDDTLLSKTFIRTDNSYTFTESQKKEIME